MPAPAFSDPFVSIYHGDSWALAPMLDPQSINCIVTSPPYWGLRDYGEPGQFGLEKTPEEYVARLVDLFRLLRPALRDDGTVWLNLGDSYAVYWGDKRARDEGRPSSADTNGWTNGFNENARPNFHAAFDGSGLKPKDLVGIPWRVAFALQADGWYLRQDIIWAKPNPMPESVTDRCTKAHEFIFLLSKRERYYYDAEAIAEDVAPATVERLGQSTLADQRGSDRVPGKINGRMKAVPPRFGGSKYGDSDSPETRTKSGKEYDGCKGKRNRRSVWTVATQPFSAAHFATFPPELIRPCILAGAPERCCPECGAPWERVVEKESHVRRERGIDASMYRALGHPQQAGVTTTTTTKGFIPTCTCGHEPIGGTVLDPFMGSGTTAAVARKLGRRAVGFELNAEYIEIAAEHRLSEGMLL